MLYRPILSGRISKWVYTLIGCDLAFEPLRILKGQILTNFIIRHGIDLGYEINYLFLPHGGFVSIKSTCKEGQGVSIITISHNGVV
jgi:hypothetical protein